MPARVAHSPSPLLITTTTTAASTQQQEEDVVNDMLRQLTAEELETAARSTYAYGRRRRINDEDPTAVVLQQQQHECAAAMAQRYLVSKKGNVDKAMKKLKATLQFRRENAIDTTTTTTFDNDDNKRLYHMLASTKKLYVAGRDKEGRATYVFVPRRVVDHDLQLTRQAHLWTLEKAIACTQSTDGTINAIVDFADFDGLRQAPPLANGKDMLTLLRDHYVGRVHRIYFVNTPKSIHWLWSLFSPFAGTATKEKIVFVSQQQQQSVLWDAYAPDQVPASCMHGGTWDDATFAMDSFLRLLPFDQLLGDKC